MDDATLKALGRLIGEITDLKLSEVDKKLAGITPPEPKSYDDEIGELRATIDAQSDLLASAESVINDLTKTVDVLTDRLEATETAAKSELEHVWKSVSDLEKSAESSEIEERLEFLDKAFATQTERLDKTVSQDEFDAVSLTVSGCVKVEEFTDTIERLGAIENSIEALPTMDDHHKQVMAAVETAFDEEWQHKFAAMIPDSLDEDRIKAEIVGELAKDIPEMVLKAVPEPQMPELNITHVAPALKELYPTIRHDVLQRIPTPSHKGVWKPDIEYDLGDEVVKDGNTFRLMEPTSDAPPSDCWQMVAMRGVGKRGKPGVKGDQGDKGDDGVGVEDILMEDGQIVISLTNGETKIFDLGLSDKLAEAVKAFMLDVKGENDDPAT
jgi:archaellum component FlaC